MVVMELEHYLYSLHLNGVDTEVSDLPWLSEIEFQFKKFEKDWEDLRLFI